MRFDQPIGPQALRDAQAWAGGWYDANPFGTLYANPATGLAAYHTGADLNMIGDADAHQVVYASADGLVVFAGALAVWGNVIVIKHTADAVWTRYGHVEGMVVKVGDKVQRGQPIAKVGNANGTMAYHCHFDVARVDLGARPGDWPGTDKARLMRDYVDPKVWINAHREGGSVTRGDPRVQYGRTYNALHPSVTLEQAKSILAQVWANGETVGKSFDDAGVGNLDTRVARLWGIPESDKAAYTQFYQVYYPGVQVQFANPNQPPPVVTGKAAIGLHVIHRHDIAERELLKGCPLVVVMDGKVSARNMALAHPTQKVVYRRWIGTSWPTPTEMVNLLEVAADDPPNLLYVGLNEGDAGGNTGDLKARAAWDTEVAKRIKDKGSKALYLAGSLGHGNPPGDFETIWGPFGDAYRTGYNSGLFGFDLHGYSCGRPLRAGQYEPPIYYETRWQRFFTHAGFDPRIKAIYQTEAGIEGGCKAGGVGGGFPANGYTQDEFAQWLSYWLTLQRQPITVNGVQYESPFVAGAIFQAGDTNTLLVDLSTPDWVAEYWAFERMKRGLDGFVAQAGWSGYNLDSDKYLVPLRATW